MKRLCKTIDINRLENQYRELMDKKYVSENKPLVMKNQVNDEKKTFFIQPGNMLIDYDDNLINTQMRPGIPGFWSSSERWIYR